MDISIYTIQLAQWREAKRLNIPILNITAASGVKEFAPDYGLVMEFKKGLLTKEEYTVRYIQKMRQSLRQYPDIWKTLADNKEIALGCYCNYGSFCHRHIFADLMEKYLVANGHNVSRQHEIIKNERQE